MQQAIRIGYLNHFLDNRVMESHFDDVNKNWENSHRGIICSTELNKKNDVCIEVVNPQEFPRGIEGVWSPEHLFVAAASGCLMTTFLAIAEKYTLDFISFSCKAKGKLESLDGKLMISEIFLYPEVVIHKQAHRNKAIRILKKAEDACLINHAISSEIITQANIQVHTILIENE